MILRLRYSDGLIHGVMLGWILALLTFAIVERWL